MTLVWNLTSSSPPSGNRWKLPSVTTCNCVSNAHWDCAIGTCLCRASQKYARTAILLCILANNDCFVSFLYCFSGFIINWYPACRTVARTLTGQRLVRYRNCTRRGLAEFQLGLITIVLWFHARFVTLFESFPRSQTFRKWRFLPTFRIRVQFISRQPREPDRTVPSHPKAQVRACLHMFRQIECG